MMMKYAILGACASTAVLASPLDVKRQGNILENEQIRNYEGQCLYVDTTPRNGTHRTPVQFAKCGSTDGQGWDVIQKNLFGKKPLVHIVNNQSGECVELDIANIMGSEVTMQSCKSNNGQSGPDLVMSELPNGGVNFARPSHGDDSLCLLGAGQEVGVGSCNGQLEEVKFSLGTVIVNPLRDDDQQAGNELPTLTKRQEDYPTEVAPGDDEDYPGGRAVGEVEKRQDEPQPNSTGEAIEYPTATSTQAIEARFIQQDTEEATEYPTATSIVGV